MIIGVPKEIKDNENRVGLTPAAVSSLTQHGHQVLVQSGAGEGSFLSDAEYQAAGATLVATAQQAWAAELVVKVKEPIAQEYPFFRADLLLFTYLHLASNRVLTESLLNAGTTGIAYETVQQQGQLPLLTPMSEVAGRMATQVGAAYLQKTYGGRGVLMSGVPGVEPANVVILGGGIVGMNAARVAVGMGAQVTILDVNHERLKYLDDLYRGQLQTCYSNDFSIKEAVYQADLVIGAVLIAGGRAPCLITRAMLADMRKNAVIVDVAVDQGGCVETIKPTTHSQPSYEVDGIVHYGVANMPAAVPRTSTFALNHQTMPYVLRLANQGLEALRNDLPLQQGVNTHRGLLTYQAVAQTFDLPYTAPLQALTA